jgi:AAA15 family ATPase/GTPase
MESNHNSTLIFEEPESFAFPYYTKYLGERIAFDKTNQYFISTHNPYLLFAILEKTSKDAVNVFITYLKDYETKVKMLTDEEIPILMDADPFFNLGYFLEEE